jgi:hypothetical protein
MKPCGAKGALYLKRGLLPGGEPMIASKRSSIAAGRAARKIDKPSSARTAVAVRAELGFGDFARIDPYTLAKLYGLTWLKIADL